MIFRPELARKIIDGDKSQTRRPVRFAAADRGGPVVNNKRGRHRQLTPYVKQDYAGSKVVVPCRYAANTDYALQRGRGEPAIPGIRLLVLITPAIEDLGSIDDPGAELEGFDNRAEFVDYWTDLYGNFKPDQKVWVISFRPILDTDQVHLLRAALPVGRPERDRQGMVAEPTAEKIAAARVNGAYTRTPVAALEDEPEAIQEDELDEITKKANDRWEHYVATEREEEQARRGARRVGGMLREAAIQLARNGGDPVAMLADIERQLATKMRETDRKAAAA